MLQKNSHGHPVVTFTGQSLTGLRTLEFLESTDLQIESSAWHLFGPEYDACHRLKKGPYEVALIPSIMLVDKYRACTTEIAQREAVACGYSQPLAGIVPWLCREVSLAEMAALKLCFIAVPHKPMIDGMGIPRILKIRPGYPKPRSLDTHWEVPTTRWFGAVAFAYIVQ